MEFCVTRKNTKEDYESFHQNFIVSRKLFVYLSFILLVNLYLISILALATIIFLQAKSLTLCVVFTLTLALAIFRTKLLTKKTSHWAEVNFTFYSKDLPEMTAIFQEEKIILKNTFEEISMPAKSVYSIYLDDNAIYFYLTKAHQFFVLKSNFASEEKWQDFYNFVKANYCTIKRVHTRNKISKKDYVFAILFGLVIFSIIFIALFAKVFLASM